MRVFYDLLKAPLGATQSRKRKFHNIPFPRKPSLFFCHIPIFSYLPANCNTPSPLSFSSALVKINFLCYTCVKRAFFPEGR